MGLSGVGAGQSVCAGGGGGGDDDGDLLELKAELDARAAREGLDERVGQQLLLRLRERRLKAEAAHAEPRLQQELGEAIVKVRGAIEELSVERT